VHIEVLYERTRIRGKRLNDGASFARFCGNGTPLQAERSRCRNRRLSREGEKRKGHWFIQDVAQGKLVRLPDNRA